MLAEYAGHAALVGFTEAAGQWDEDRAGEGDDETRIPTRREYVAWFASTAIEGVKDKDQGKVWAAAMAEAETAYDAWHEAALETVERILARDEPPGEAAAGEPPIEVKSAPPRAGADGAPNPRISAPANRVTPVNPPHLRHASPQRAETAARPAVGRVTRRRRTLSPPVQADAASSRPRRFPMPTLLKSGAAILGAAGALALAAPLGAQGDNPNNGGAKIAASLTGAAAVPAGDANGAGLFEARVNPGTERICYSIEASSIANATAARIYSGAPGAAGEPVLTLDTPDGDDDDSEECQDIDRSLAQAILRDPAKYYVSVENGEFPSGAIRGQLMRG
jgi:hypothetical protein